MQYTQLVYDDIVASRRTCDTYIIVHTHTSEIHSELVSITVNVGPQCTYYLVADK